MSDPSVHPPAGAAGDPAEDPPGLLVTHGARATEAVLGELVDAALAQPGRRLDRPVRLVVPSTSLRLHLGRRLVARRGALLGITVQTLYGVAREILERCGQAPPVGGLPGDLPFEVLVRRLAAAEPALSRGLDFLVDGYGAVAASVRDLLDAGLEPVLAEAAGEALEHALTDEACFTSRAEVDRAQALVRVAARVDEALAVVRAVRRAAMFGRAADLLVADPDHALPAAAVLVHGFADATGLASELLVALVRHRGGRLLLDAPPDPARPAGGALPPRWQEAFSERLRERLAGRAGETEARPADGAPPSPRVSLFVAPGSDAEAREVAVRVRRLLDGGAAPEGIGIVARDPEPLRRALRHHLSQLGVPFSGIRTPGSLTAAGRRSRALLDLLRRQGELPADRWLDAAATLPRAASTHSGGGGERSPFVDLRLAFYATGCGRLRDVADLDLDALLGDRRALPLPVRRGFSYAADDAGDDAGDDRDEPPEDGRPRTSYARRRHVPRPLLAGAVEAAGALLAHLRAWPDTAPPAEHLEALRHLLVEELGWHPEEASAHPVFTALEALLRDLPPALALTFDELRLVLGRALDGAGHTPFGGAGGGVQVMTVMEARGRTFDHLFLAGAHRGAFPRNVRPDPLLPDELRRALAAVLPDVPRKRAGFDEERYLFAQLLSAAPAVAVSWSSRDDEGQPQAPSPLVERLAGPEGIAEPGAGNPHAPRGDGLPAFAVAPPVYGDGGRGDDGDAPRGAPRPAREEAVRAALAGAPRAVFGDLLATAVEESRHGLPRPALALDAGRLAAARLRILDEVDPDLATDAGRATAAALGPYHGFLGPLDAGRDDPRRAAPWVTHAENLAACPWQTFLRKILRVEPTPDPLQALPGADPLLLGNVVHRVLEGLAAEAGAPVRVSLQEALGEALAGEAVPLPWPEPEELEGRLRAAAGDALREDGAPLPGLIRALAARARPYLERAREIEAAAPPGRVLGAEIFGEVEATAGSPPAGGPREAAARRLRFIADRVDRRPDGGLLLTDYKTGKPLSEGKRESTRRRHHLQAVRAGTRLQAVAYALAARSALGTEDGSTAGTAGRYLFLRPDLEDPAAADVSAAADDADLAAAFTAAVGTVLAAWDAGAFFPRVVDASGENEPPRCAWCEVSEACLRGDSAARIRLHRWNREHAGTATSRPERSHHEAWRLPERQPGDAPGHSPGAGGGDPAPEDPR